MTERLLKIPALPFSIAIHLSIIFLVLILVYKPEMNYKNIEVAVIEAPIPSSIPQKVPEQIKEKPKVEPIKKEAVFGISRKALTSDMAEGESVKLGNTVAKTPDDTKLKDSDADLPIPAEEYTVSSMPKLKSEIRVPYPIEARKKGIQGAVIMDLLIDQLGKVRQVSVVDGPGYGLNEAAAEGMKNFIFEPAKIGTQSVAVRIRYSYRFVIEK